MRLRRVAVQPVPLPGVLLHLPGHLRPPHAHRAVPADGLRLPDGEGDTAATVAPSATASGSCHAVVIWFDLDLDGSTVLSNGPHVKGTHWRQAVQTFDRPVAVAAGERVPLLAEHDGERILVRPGGTGQEAGRG
ncbi:hypothetical protein ACFQXA_25450 [Nocardiopsis composta]